MSTYSFDLYALTTLLILAVAMPLTGIWDFRRLIRWTEEGRPDARIRSYQWVLAVEWILTAGLLGWWMLSGRDPAAVGLIPEAEGWQWLAIGLGLAGTIAMVVQTAYIIRDPKQLQKINEQIGDLKALAPRTAGENRLFALVAVTAGLCEEILYRGVLLAVLAPVTGIWAAVVLTSVIFGLGHAYQGFAGMIKTALVGLIMALLTVFSGTIFIAILLHAVIDLTSGRTMSSALFSAPTPATND